MISTHGFQPTIMADVARKDRAFRREAERNTAPFTTPEGISHEVDYAFLLYKR
jgi:hypothetical protein